MGLNGVPVAPHKLILGESEATPSRKLLKHLPDIKTAINITKIAKQLPINRPSGRYVNPSYHIPSARAHQMESCVVCGSLTPYPVMRIP